MASGKGTGNLCCGETEIWIGWLLTLAVVSRTHTLPCSCTNRFASALDRPRKTYKHIPLTAYIIPITLALGLKEFFAGGAIYSAL